MNPNGSIILAKGKANIAFYWDAAVLIIYSLSLWLAVKTNQLEVVAWTYAGVSLLNFFVGRWLLNWLIQLRFRQYLKTISLPFLLSMLISVVAFYLKEISIRYFSKTSFWPLIFSVGLSGLIYILLLYKIYPDFFMRIVKKQIRGQT